MKNKNTENKKITKDMVIRDIIKANPASAKIMMQHGLHCIGCPAASGETLEQGAGAHGIDADEIVKDINKNQKTQ